MLFLATITTERDWPWRDGDLFGWPGLLAIALGLVVVTLWTYSGQRTVGWNKVLAVLGLRLAALAVIVLLLLRPSFGSEQDVVNPGRLILVVDSSLSMKINDAPANSTRWEFVRKLLDWPEVKEALQRLQKDRQIDIVFYQAAEDVHKYDPSSDADGKRTDIGKWLNTLWRIHQNDGNLRGLVLLTDGADNGTSFAVLDEAARWREFPCPIHAFGVGSETTSKGQRDIAVVDVKAGRDPIYLKSKVPIKAIIDAPNLEGQNVTVRLLIDGKEVKVKENVTLLSTRGNVVDAGEFVADHIGEVKVTVKVDEVPGEVAILNNEMSTYVNVRKEGVNVLWVEGRRREQTVSVINQALSNNPRLSITYDLRTTDAALTPEQLEIFTTPEKAFDVVVIGDISAKRLAGANAAVFERIAKAVNDRKTGLLMVGDYQMFGENSDWRSAAKALTTVLPVELAGSGQFEGEVRALPLAKGHRLLQLGVPDNKDLWGERPDPQIPKNAGIFKPLAGQSKFGKLKDSGVALLATEEGPLLVVTRDAGPRVAVFGGDTTHTAWCQNEDAVRPFERFWNQLIAWLARQEDGDSQVSVKLDKRRIAVGANLKLGFTVSAIGKDGQPIGNARYTVKVQGPGGELFDVPTGLKLGEERGAFGQANVVGEYKLIVTATAPGPKGQEMSLGSASARFMGFAEDVENQQPAANHKDLAKLAAAGGGAFHIAGKEELLQYLHELRDRSSPPGWVKRDLWPNWKMPPASDGWNDQLGALVRSMVLPCLVLFVMCLTAEWFLRRWWGLV